MKRSERQWLTRCLFCLGLFSMPKKPLRPCLYPGCPELTNQTYCMKHQLKRMQQRRRDKAKQDEYYDRFKRDQQSKQFYHSKDWKKAREQALVRDNYLCQHCLKKKRFTRATIVHHIVEVKEDWGKRFDIDNLISLCAACHNRVHAGKAGHPPG